MMLGWMRINTVTTTNDTDFHAFYTTFCAFVLLFFTSITVIFELLNLLKALN